MFLDHRLVQFGNGRLRASLERTEEAVLEKNVTGCPTGVARGDGAPAEIGLYLAGRNPNGLDGAGACC